MANNCPPTDVHYRLIELILFIVICSKVNLINCNFNKCDGKLLTEEICLPTTYQKSTLPFFVRLLKLTQIKNNPSGPPII